MKKEYNATLDEVVHANFRLTELAGTVSKQKWFGFVWLPIIFLVIYCIIPRNQIESLILACIASLVYIPVHLLTYKNQIRKQLRKAMIKALGTDQPTPCEYELTQEGFLFSTMGQELRCSWRNVTQLVETADSLEIIMKPTGIAIIPKRIFSDPSELQQWMMFIDQHKEADNPSAPGE